MHLQAASKAGTEAGQSVNATAGLHTAHTVKEQAATRPVAARAAEAPAAAAASASPSAGKPAASSSPSAASPACSAEPETLSDWSSPVQIVQQEDVGDVDIGDDCPAPDVDEAKVSASASAAARAAHSAAKAAAAGASVTGAEAATSAQAGTTAEKASLDTQPVVQLVLGKQQMQQLLKLRRLHHFLVRSPPKLIQQCTLLPCPATLMSLDSFPPLYTYPNCTVAYALLAGISNDL